MPVNSNSWLTVCVNPSRVSRVLACIAVGLVVIGTFANVLIHQLLPSPDHKLARLLNRFDIGHEPGIPQWFSSLLLLAAALLLLVIARHAKKNGLRLLGHWHLLSVLFFLLALDEAVCIHEMADATLHNWLDTGGWLYFAWVIPAAVFVLSVVIFFAPLLRHLDSPTRWGFVLSGAIFVGGAVGVEMVSGAVLDQMCRELPSGRIVQVQPYGLAAFTACQAVEECMEMLGVVLFIYVLMQYIQRHVGPLRFDVSMPSKSTDPNYA